MAEPVNTKPVIRGPLLNFLIVPASHTGLGSFLADFKANPNCFFYFLERVTTLVYVQSCIFWVNTIVTITSELPACRPIVIVIRRDDIFAGNDSDLWPSLLVNLIFIVVRKLSPSNDPSYFRRHILSFMTPISIDSKV